MARIRSIKPEFWDSPSTAKAGPWSRLLFIAMWNWADDYGRGTANLKELEGFAFPNDSTFTDMHGNTVHFRELVAEVSECFGVVFYTSGNRPYYAIPSWETHQRNERRAKQSKYPPPPASPQVSTTTSEPVADTPRNDTEIPHTSGPGTGEEGNRGRGEQGITPSSEIAGDPEREDVTALLDLLDREIEANGNRPPKRSKANRDAMRLLLDRDHRTPDQVAYVIRWCQADDFWQANILSASKLREKFDQLVAKIRSNHQRANRPSEKEQRNQDILNAFVAEEDHPYIEGIPA